MTDKEPQPTAPAPLRKGSDAFVTNVLGGHSSHPQMEGRRLGWWFFVTAIPVALVLASLAIWYFIDWPSGLANQVEHALRAMWWAILALVFGSALSMAALLSVRASAGEARSKGHGVASPLLSWVQWLVVLVAAAAIAFGVAYLASAVTGRWRWLLLLAAALPLVALDAALSLRRRQEADRSSLLSFLWSVFTSSAGIAAALVLFASVPTGVTEAIGWIIRTADEYAKGVPFLERMVEVARVSAEESQIGRFLGIIVVLVAMGLLVTRLRFLSLPAKAKDDGEEKARAKKGCLGRLLGWLPWLKDRVGDDGDSEAEGPSVEDRHPWIAQLRTKFEEEARRISDEAVAALKVQSVPKSNQAGDEQETAAEGLEQRRKLDWMFQSHCPTASQLGAFDRFRLRYQGVVDTLRENEAKGLFSGLRVTPDLLVLSEPGAGRTTALQAMAIFAAVARGQRVLFVTGSVAESRKVAASINESLRHGFLGHLVRAAAGSSAEDPWMARLSSIARARLDSDPSESTPDGEGAPQILVGQIEELEALLFGSGSDVAARRAYLQAVGLVIVDSLDPFVADPVVNIHLPFWLDKLRLGSDCRGFPLQVVIGVPDLGRWSDDERKNAAGVAVRQYLMNRLLGTADETDDAVYTIKPFRQNSAIVLDAHASGLEEQDVVIALTSALAALGRKTVVFKNDLRSEDRAKLESKIREATVASKAEVAPRVVNSVLQLEDESLRDATVIVIHDVSHGRMIVRIASRLSTSEPVFIRVGVAGSTNAWNSGLAVTLPVLCSRTAEPMQISHLKSLAPMLGQHLPVRQERLLKFGMQDLDGYLSRPDGTGGGDRIPSFPWSLHLDRVDRRVGTADREVIWDAAHLRSRTGADFGASAVELHVPLEEGMGFQVDRPCDLVVARSSVIVDPRRFVEWTDRDGVKLGMAMDLAQVPDFSYQVERNGRERWIARQVLIRANGERTVQAMPWRDESSDPRLPVVDVDFKLHARHEFYPSPQVLPRGMRLQATARHSPPVEVTQRILELASEAGHRVDVPNLEWRQDAALTTLLLGVPSGDLGEDDVSRFTAALLGRWSTSMVAWNGERAFSQAFWPLMTAAWQDALEQVAPDFGRFGRVMAFHAPTGCEGAVLFILEPLATAGSAYEALLAILENRALASILRERIDAFLTGAVGQVLPPMAPAFKQGLGTTVTGNDSALVRTVVQLGFEGVSDDARRIEARFGSIRRASAPREPKDYVPGGVLASGRCGESGDRCFLDHNSAQARFDPSGDRIIASSGLEVKYATGISKEVADAATHAFGADGDVFEASCAIDETARAAHAARGICMRSDGHLSIDYEWMIRKSLKDLEPLASALKSACKEAGLTTVRSMVGVFAALVQSLEYEASREARRSDGRLAFGVQMPAATLFEGIGDCDSRAVLLATLLRAGGICKSGVVLVGPTAEDWAREGAEASGHAIVAVEVEVHEFDDVLIVSRAERETRLVLIESTSPCALGNISKSYDEYVGVLVGWG